MSNNNLGFCIVGFSFRSCKPEILYDVDSIELVAEPDNRYDKNAVKVLVDNNKHIGYVARQHAKRILDIINKHSNYNIGIVDTYKQYADCTLILDKA